MKENSCCKCKTTFQKGHNNFRTHGVLWELRSHQPVNWPILATVEDIYEDPGDVLAWPLIGEHRSTESHPTIQRGILLLLTQVFLICWVNIMKNRQKNFERLLMNCPKFWKYNNKNGQVTDNWLCNYVQWNNIGRLKANDCKAAEETKERKSSLKP